MAFVDIENDGVSPDALRSIATGRYHVKVGWGSGAGPEELDGECYCTPAPCGFVQDDHPRCRSHGIKTAQQPRQRHKVVDCPAAR